MKNLREYLTEQNHLDEKAKEISLKNNDAILIMETFNEMESSKGFVIDWTVNEKFHIIDKSPANVLKLRYFSDEVLKKELGFVPDFSEDQMWVNDEEYSEEIKAVRNFYDKKAEELKKEVEAHKKNVKNKRSKLRSIIENFDFESAQGQIEFIYALFNSEVADKKKFSGYIDGEVSDNDFKILEKFSSENNIDEMTLDEFYNKLNEKGFGDATRVKNIIEESYDTIVETAKSNQRKFVNDLSFAFGERFKKFPESIFGKRGIKGADL